MILIWRYRHVSSPFLVVVALPVLAALLAAAGYYDTARELLSRLFFSAGLRDSDLCRPMG